MKSQVPKLKKNKDNKTTATDYLLLWMKDKLKEKLSKTISSRIRLGKSQLLMPKLIVRTAEMREILFRCFINKEKRDRIF